MKVWLVHIGELLPGDDSYRPYRYSMLADELVKRGHTVVRWAPTFVHATKTFRVDRSEEVSVRPGYSIRLLSAGSYRRNVSISRIAFHRRFARKFAEWAKKADKPDVIVCAIPAPGIAAVAVQFGEAAGIPVVIDIRDLWPDLYKSALPRHLDWLAAPVVAALRLGIARTLRRASAIVAVSRSYLNWALTVSHRQPTERERVFPLGYSPKVVSPEQVGKNVITHDVLGSVDGEFVCCFLGLFEKTYDLETVVEAARILWESKRWDIKFVLCGDGRKRADLLKSSAGLGNVIMPGWIGGETIAVLLDQSHVGLASYARGATQGLPNKPFEYFSAGLPVVSSLGGELGELLEETETGLEYRAGDAQGLIDRIVELRDDPDLYRRLSRNAKILFEARFTASKVYGDMVEYLESVGRGASE